RLKMPDGISLPASEFKDEHEMYNMPNYADMSLEEQQETRFEFKYKFRTLAANYPHYNIIIPHEKTDLYYQHQLYDFYFRKIDIDYSVHDYKNILILIFLAIEWFFVKILGLPLSGFTKNQLALMKRYRRLLVELGEKRLIGTGAGWPVEARLVMLMLFNAVVLILVNTFISWLDPTIVANVQDYLIQFITGERGPPPTQVTANSKTGLPVAPQ